MMNKGRELCYNLQRSINVYPEIEESVGDQVVTIVHLYT